MMELSFQTYLDKVDACWIGKNIGGTLGAPFEGKRGVFDVSYYTHDLSYGVLPNDDLDLQLVFLCAAERFGRALTTQNLADYWIYGIPCDWSEYGTGRANVKFGIQPPVSGDFHNDFKNSCGCFIRSELWACLHPGHPELAVKYAYMDGCVDHAQEGVYGEIFCAAVQAAAFAEGDVRKLIEIGLSYIPQNCAVAGAVRLAMETYADRRGWKQGRQDILMAYPDTFGLMRSEPDPLIPRGEMGFDAPANIGLMVMAWLYGEGDFSKSICIATGCGEDADCTAGTLAAILGIIGGSETFEERWLAPIGREIKTCTVDRSKEDMWIATSVDQLTERVTRLMPVFMQGNYIVDKDSVMRLTMAENLLDTPRKTGWFTGITAAQEMENSFGRITGRCTTFWMGAQLDAYECKLGEPLSVKLSFENQFHRQQWLTVKLYQIDGGVLTAYAERTVFLNNYTAGSSTAEAAFKLPTEQMQCGKHTLFAYAEVNGNVSYVTIPLVYMLV